MLNVLHGHMSKTDKLIIIVFLNQVFLLSVQMQFVYQGVKPKQNNQQVAWVYINRTLSQSNPGAARGIVHAPLWLESTSMRNQWFVNLDIFIDHSVIEVFEPEGGQFVITARVYPEEANANNIGAYVTNSTGNIVINTIDIWNLTTIWT